MMLKTYQAYTMAEALAAVKRDLGADAVILNTRTFKRGGVIGVGAKTIVEVTATPAGEAARHGGESMARSPRSKNVAAERAYAGTGAAKSNLPVLDDRIRTKRLAMAMEEAHLRARSTQANDAEAGPIAQGAQGVPSVSPTNAAVAASGPRSRTMRVREASPPTSSRDDAAAAARRFVLLPPDPVTVDAIPAATGAAAVTRTVAAAPSSSVERVAGATSADTAAQGVSISMQEELAAIRDLVGQVLKRQGTRAGAATPAMPDQLYEMYLRLINQELSEDLADQVVQGVRARCSAAELGDAEFARQAVLEELTSFIPTAAEPVPEHSPDARPLTIALVGPTGVGKTTTLAKLAASFKLRHGRKVGLITADTYRIAAVDQLRTYANIIGLPLQVALTPADMKQAVHALGECDVILIDTAGRSQHDTNRIEELKQLLCAAEPHEVHLVLSSTAAEPVLLKEAEAFSEVGVHKIVLTKLDEAVNFGMLVNVVRKVGKALSFVTTGQEVPDHLEVGRADRLASLILGGAVSA